MKQIFITLIIFLESFGLSAQTNHVLFSKKVDTILFPKTLNTIRLDHYSFRVETYSVNNAVKNDTLSDRNQSAKFIGRKHDTLQFELLLPNQLNIADSISIQGAASFLYNHGGGTKSMKVFEFSINKEIPPLKIKLHSVPDNLATYYFTTTEWEKLYPFIFKPENKISLEQHRFGRGYTPTEMIVMAYTYKVCVLINGKLFIKSSSPDYDNPVDDIEVNTLKETPLPWR